MIEYTSSLDGIQHSMLKGFFIGWPNPPSTKCHFKILQKSYRFILATDNKEVIGFITCISDGILTAYIPLLEVLPPYKNQGIGKMLVKLLLKELNHLYMIDLICDSTLQEYYKHLGMQKADGAMIRNYMNQSGLNNSHQ